jgi:hypothetical protein
VLAGDATVVAGLGTWLLRRRGRKAIRIIASLPIKERDRVTAEESARRHPLQDVFDFEAQRVHPLAPGKPTPLQPAQPRVSGDTHAHLIAPAIAFAESLD